MAEQTPYREEGMQTDQQPSDAMIEAGAKALVRKSLDKTDGWTWADLTRQERDAYGEDALTAYLAMRQHDDLLLQLCEALQVRIDTICDSVTGSEYLEVTRIEREDDGSRTVVVVKDCRAQIAALHPTGESP